jgi:phospholipid N-methyltransferase
MNISRLIQNGKSDVHDGITMTNTLTTHLNFFWAGLLKQGQTGGIVPSQRFLIAKMIAPVPEAYRGQIIELGAGTGALTLRLAARCPGARILACELNPTLARDCRDNLMRAGHNGRVEVVSASAEHLLSEMGRRGMEKPDFIISGIPLGNLGGERVRSLLDAIRQTLGAGGMFIQFQHSLLDRKKIMAKFPNTRTVPVFLNFPPAAVYYAQNSVWSAK